MNSKQLTLTGWGRSSQSNVMAFRPERYNDVVSAINSNYAKGIIAYGKGRSYGDIALNNDGHVILTQRLNRLLSFNEQSGELICEPGVTFQDLHNVFLARGYMAPVSPGTAFATIGGAVVNDVHGKNHDKVGSFANHVKWLELILPSGENYKISPSENADIFAATIGGLGLTGFIHKICFQLQKASAFVNVREQRINDLESFFAALLESRDSALFSVGWIDCFAKGASLGRGILMTADFTKEIPSKNRKLKSRRVPFDFPSFTLNPMSINLFNEMYFRRVPAAGRTRIMPVFDFLYPLDNLHDWNRIYGKKGFYQFQCVIPDDAAFEGMKKLMQEISKAKSASFLSVLKTLGSEGIGCLSFPLKGFTLALDFPRKKGIEILLQKLEKIVLDFGGRIYLAKDATLDSSSFIQMYPQYEKFQNVIARIDPNEKFQSDMSRRLKIRK